MAPFSRPEAPTRAFILHIARDSRPLSAPGTRDIATSGSIAIAKPLTASSPFSKGQTSPQAMARNGSRDCRVCSCGRRGSNPHRSQGFFFGAGRLNAAFTSSSLMRFAGSPRCPRFCSSVPSPIIPRWIVGRGCLASFLAFFGSGLSVTGKSFALAGLGSLRNAGRSSNTTPTTEPENQQGGRSSEVSSLKSSVALVQNQRPRP